MTTQKLLEAAERVVRARAELAAAEAAFEALTGNKGPQERVPTKPQAPQGGVAETVRAILKRRPAGLAFGQLAELAGGNTVAVRSAVKKERERGHVVFEGGLYRWSAVKHDVKAGAPLRVPAKPGLAAGPVVSGGGQARGGRVRKRPARQGAAGPAAAGQQGGQ